MRYTLLMHSIEPAPGDIPEDAIRETEEAFGAYGRALTEFAEQCRRMSRAARLVFLAMAGLLFAMLAGCSEQQTTTRPALVPTAGSRGFTILTPGCSRPGAARCPKTEL